MFFFFFKQKTAYEMRISDWSSDVCSSDLRQDGYENKSFLDGVVEVLEGRPVLPLEQAQRQRHENADQAGEGRRVVVDEQIQDDDEGYEEGRQQSEDHAAVGIFLEPRQPKAPGVDDDADADAGEVQKRRDERRERDAETGMVERSEESRVGKGCV